jgi:ribosomal protein S2
MNSIDKMLTDPAISITKKERLTLSREKDKLGKSIGWCCKPEQIAKCSIYGRYTP